MEALKQTAEEELIILICLSASPSNRHVIHAASKVARRGCRSAIALYVGRSREQNEENPSLQENITLAKNEGFEIHFAESNDIPLTIAEYARRVGATDVFLGLSHSDSFFPYRKPAPVQISEYLPDADVHIIPDSRASVYPEIRKKENSFSWKLRDFLLVIVIMTIATLLSAWFDQSRFSNANIITIYILAVLIASLLTSHRFYGILSAVLYILLFNYLFIDPRFTLLVYDPNYMMTYFVTVIAAFLTGSITIRMKSIARLSAENAYQAKVLLDTSNQLELATDRKDIIRITCMQLAHLLNRNILYYGEGQFRSPAIYSLDHAGVNQSAYEKEIPAVKWSAENHHHSGAFTSHFPGYTCRYYSIGSAEEPFGVIGIDMRNARFTEFENSILLSILREFTMALEKEEIFKRQKEAEVKAENEHLRAGLLRSISHDLRTPLTSIYGNALNLETNEDQLTPEERQNIYHDLAEDSQWLNTQMENILAMTRLENHAVLNLSVENVYDVVTESIEHVMPHPDHKIDISGVSEDTFAEMDARLIIQVLINLINNAVKYTPKGSTVTIATECAGERVSVSVADDGNGIPDSEKPHIFELFYTGERKRTDSYRSLGVGLNLCSGILAAHDSTITVANNVPRGTVFRFELAKKDVVL